MAINDISLISSLRSNLAALKNSSNALSKTEERLSTGKAVNTPTDNPTNFSIAQGLLSRSADLSANKDAVANSIKTDNIAQVGYQRVTSLLQSAQGIASAAKSISDPTEQAGYAATYKTLISQAGQTANEAGIGSSVSSILPSGALSDQSASELESAIGSIRSQSAASATTLNGTSIIQDFTNNMISTLQAAAGNLTVSDLNQEAAIALSQQTEQQLGVASLGMSSKSSQSLLRLF
ncbi:MAG: flagellin [Desulfuromonadaceae bacterium]|nr:flagellin [Desulfuromonadaceae bacterium]